MDAKAVSWVGDMYQKFESMCVEVEDNVYQDTVKYVESQVKTVGACVKRFYTDVMQDLLPLSSDDLAKPQSAPAHIVNYAGDIIHDMSEVNTKKEFIKASTEKSRKDSHPACWSGEKADDRLSAKSCNEANLCQLPFEESSKAKCHDFHVEQSDTEYISLGDEDNSEENLLPCVISVQKISLEGGACEAGEGEACVENDDTNKSVASTSILSRSSHATALDELGNSGDTLKELDGISYETIRDEIEYDYADKQEVQNSLRVKTKLEESCVLVDNYEPFSPSRLEGKQRSYKKKIKDVFYPRSWSRSKSQANEQLTLGHRDIESGSEQGRTNTNSMVPAAAPGASNSLEQCKESFESGWEIL